MHGVPGINVPILARNPVHRAKVQTIADLLFGGLFIEKDGPRLNFNNVINCYAVVIAPLLSGQIDP